MSFLTKVINFGGEPIFSKDLGLRVRIRVCFIWYSLYYAIITSANWTVFLWTAGLEST